MASEATWRMRFGSCPTVRQRPEIESALRRQSLAHKETDKRHNESVEHTIKNAIGAVGDERPHVR